MRQSTLDGMLNLPKSDVKAASTPASTAATTTKSVVAAAAAAAQAVSKLSSMAPPTASTTASSKVASTVVPEKETAATAARVAAAAAVVDSVQLPNTTAAPKTIAATTTTRDGKVNPVTAKVEKATLAAAIGAAKKAAVQAPQKQHEVIDLLSDDDDEVDDAPSTKDLKTTNQTMSEQQSNRSSSRHQGGVVANGTAKVLTATATNAAPLATATSAIKSQPANRVTTAKEAFEPPKATFTAKSAATKATTAATSTAPTTINTLTPRKKVLEVKVNLCKSRSLPAPVVVVAAATDTTLATSAIAATAATAAAAAAKTKASTQPDVTPAAAAAAATAATATAFQPITSLSFSPKATLSTQSSLSRPDGSSSPESLQLQQEFERALAASSAAPILRQQSQPPLATALLSTAATTAASVPKGLTTATAAAASASTSATVATTTNATAALRPPVKRRKCLNEKKMDAGDDKNSNSNENVSISSNSNGGGGGPTKKKRRTIRLRIVTSNDGNANDSSSVGSSTVDPSDSATAAVPGAAHKTAAAATAAPLATLGAATVEPVKPKKPADNVPSRRLGGAAAATTTAQQAKVGSSMPPPVKVGNVGSSSSSSSNNGRDAVSQSTAQDVATAMTQASDPINGTNPLAAPAARHGPLGQQPSSSSLPSESAAPESALSPPPPPVRDASVVTAKHPTAVSKRNVSRVLTDGFAWRDFSAAEQVLLNHSDQYFDIPPTGRVTLYNTLVQAVREAVLDAGHAIDPNLDDEKLLDSIRTFYKTRAQTAPKRSKISSARGFDWLAAPSDAPENDAAEHRAATTANPKDTSKESGTTRMDDSPTTIVDNRETGVDLSSSLVVADEQRLPVDNPTEDYPMPDEDDPIDDPTGSVHLSEPLSTKALASKCWNCWISLVASPEDPEPCLFSTHLHPVLDVRMCAVCAQEVAAVERLTDVEEKSKTCAGCAVDEDDLDTTFFLCDSDNSRCGRVFCRHCVAQTLGGGSHGWERTANLIETTDESWYCAVCRPPAELEELRETVAAELATSSGIERSAEDLLELLARAEEAKALCEAEGDGESLNSEANAYLQDRDVLLSDFIAALLDELGIRHSMTPAMCYCELGMALPETPTRDPDCDDDSDIDGDTARAQEPDWVREANRKVDRRNEKRRRTKWTNILAEYDYKKDDYANVDDLGSEDLKTGDTTTKLRKGFFDRDPPTDEEIRFANSNEAQQLKLLNITFADAVDDEADRKANLDEERCTVQGGARKDFKRPRLSSSSSPSGATTGTTASMEQRTSDQRNRRPSSPNTATVPSLETLTTSDAPIAMANPNIAKQETNTSQVDAVASVAPTAPTAATDLAEEGVDNLQTGDDMSISDDDVVVVEPATRVAAATPKKSRTTKAQSDDTGVSPAPFATPPHLKNKKGQLKLCIKGERVHDEFRNVRSVSVHSQLSKDLKEHQREGIQFMWNNSFGDFAYKNEGDDSQIGGCVLAHSMGLGKSLSAIALIHTILTHRDMEFPKGGTRLIQKVVLVVPVNTVTNWENEFTIWQEGLKNPVAVTSLNDVKPERRAATIQKWTDGVLLATDGILQNCKGLETYLKPDVLVVDEAHTMIRNPRNKGFLMLKSIAPRRIIALTGSPFQNNLCEYFQMINFLRPNILGHSNESMFKEEYARPIEDGMASNASKMRVVDSLRKAEKLHELFGPYVHRKDSNVLREYLPHIQQVVLSVRQTRVQAKLIQAHHRSLDTDGDLRSNFLKQYNGLRPVNSHPGSLLFPSEKKKKKGDDDDDEDEIGDWWTSTVEDLGDEKVKCVTQGFKIVLLFHLLAAAEKAGDKVVVFANSLATLNYIEYALTLDWAVHVPNLSADFPDRPNVPWEKSREFYRIDGNVSATDRGTIIARFQESETAKVMLLSRAGGIGINLTSANRVVIIDQHFNPTITAQALSRVYRFGQKKPVFVYTMLTQGTTEEKVYGRCVNKTGIALRVIDSKAIDRCFTNEELQDLSNNLIWVACDYCDKWRVLLGKGADDEVPDSWDCSMNLTDSVNNNCEASEKPQSWYEERERTIGVSQPPSPAKDDNRPGGRKGRAASESLTECDDEVLQHILSVRSKTKTGKEKPLICDHHFHEALMETATVSATLEEAQQQLDDSAEMPTGSETVEKSSTGACQQEVLQSKQPVAEDPPPGLPATKDRNATPLAQIGTPPPTGASTTKSISKPIEQSSKKGPERSAATTPAQAKKLPSNSSVAKSTSRVDPPTAADKSSKADKEQGVAITGARGENSTSKNMPGPKSTTSVGAEPSPKKGATERGTKVAKEEDRPLTPTRPRRGNATTTTSEGRSAPPETQQQRLSPRLTRSTSPKLDEPKAMRGAAADKQKARRSAPAVQRTAKPEAAKPEAPKAAAAQLGEKSNYSSFGANDGKSLGGAIMLFDSDEDEPTVV